MREETLARFDHPTWIAGRQTWHPGMDLHDLADKIKNGDPTRGWEGDPRLTLARHTNPKTGEQTYELWRLDGNDYSLVARLSGDKDPYTVIPELVKRDFRRGLDLKDAVDRHNAKIQASVDAVAQDRAADAVQRLVWALRKEDAV